jgi:uncharacterized UBP type Zn finger protein
MDYLFYNSEYVPDAIGFNNTGAICWFNSLLQSLLSCSSLTEKLLDLDADNKVSNNFQYEYIKAAKQLLEIDPFTYPREYISAAVMCRLVTHKSAQTRASYTLLTRLELPQKSSITSMSAVYDVQIANI